MMETAITDELRERVLEAIDSIRPFLAADGGDMQLVDITDDMVVQVKLLGACKECQMSHMTLKAGVEEAIRRSVPQVKAVVAISH